MMKLRRNNKGETLAETIIALSIMAIGITIASSIIINSVRNLTNAKNRVIAVNIAREGIEAVRNIRDTNWLFYSDRRRTCWNHDANAGVCDGANASDVIEPGVYIVYKRDDHSWRLVPADLQTGIDEDGDGIPDNDPDTDVTRLSIVDIDNTVDSDGDGDDTNDFDMYNHEHASAVNSLGTESRSTPFRRYITIEYLENAPGADSTIDPPADAINTINEWNALDPDTEQPLLNRMRVTSTVEWIRGAIHSAELTTIITDHLGRESLQN